MRGKRARLLRSYAHEIVMQSGAKKGEFAPAKRRLYRLMKRDWTEGRRDGFKGL